MFKKKIATLGLAAVMMLGTSVTASASGSKYNGPDGNASGPSTGTTGVYIQDAGYVPPDHPGYTPASYEFEVPAQLLYAMKYDGTLVGGWMQAENENYKDYGELKNHSQLPIHFDTVTFTGNVEDWNFTDPDGENYVHFTIKCTREDNRAGEPFVLDSQLMLSGTDVSTDENFHLFYEAIPDKSDIMRVEDNETGQAYKVTHDIKKASNLGTITWLVNKESVKSVN